MEEKVKVVNLISSRVNIDVPDVRLKRVWEQKGAIKAIPFDQLEEALDFVKKVFTDSEGEESGTLVMNLVKEIRSKKYYLPELELVMIDENNEIIGYCMFSRFHIENKYDDEGRVITLEFEKLMTISPLIESKYIPDVLYNMKI